MPVAEFTSLLLSTRVPATSANLGPGFDAFGLALSRYDEVSAQVIDRGLELSVTGEGADEVPRDERHLIVRALRATFDRLGGQPPGLRLNCTNRIPHGRGLGSSAAAIVAGVELARGLVRGGLTLLDDAAALALASTIEGHPDNVAACLLGGLTVAWTAGDTATATAVRIDPDGVLPVLLIPRDESATEAARAVLPTSVPHADAAFNASRSALLMVALTGRPDLLMTATEDRLHQGYRAKQMPESSGLVSKLRAAGLPAVISGAGPTVLVLARSSVEAAGVEARCPDGWECARLPVAQGASTTAG
jgi:homoserine kinase